MRKWMKSIFTRKLSKSSMAALLMLVIVMTIMFTFSAKTFIWMDEYLFYRLSDGLPSYSVSSDWFYIDFPETVNVNDPRGAEGFREVIETVYNTPVYSHTPLSTILVYPIVKLAAYGQKLDMNEIRTLRTVPILLSTLTFGLIYILLRRKIGIYALLTFVPVLLSHNLLSGTMFFYWDVFMSFFFVLTLYFTETPGVPKWAKYITASFLVNTKMFLGVLFLIPLIAKNRKLALCVFSLLPFWLYTFYITGDPIYWYNYYMLHTGIWQGSWKLWILPAFWNIVLGWQLITYFALTAGCLALIKKHPTYVLFYGVTVAYGIGIGFGLNHMSNILYSGALVFPLVIYYSIHHILRRTNVQSVTLTIARKQDTASVVLRWLGNK